MSNQIYLGKRERANVWLCNRIEKKWYILYIMRDEISDLFFLNFFFIENSSVGTLQKGQIFHRESDKYIPN